MPECQQLNFPDNGALYQLCLATLLLLPVHSLLCTDLRKMRLYILQIVCFLPIPYSSTWWAENNDNLFSGYRSDNRIQSSIYMFFSIDWFRLTLIEFDWFNWSVWLVLLSIIEIFDCLRLSSPRSVPKISASWTMDWSWHRMRQNTTITIEYIWSK